MSRASSFDWSLVNCWNNIINVTKYLLFRCFYGADEDIHEDARTWQGPPVSRSLQSVMWTRQTDGCRSRHVGNFSNMDEVTTGPGVLFKKNLDLFSEMNWTARNLGLHITWTFGVPPRLSALFHKAGCFPYIVLKRQKWDWLFRHKYDYIVIFMVCLEGN